MGAIRGPELPRDVLSLSLAITEAGQNRKKRLGLAFDAFFHLVLTKEIFLDEVISFYRENQIIRRWELDHYSHVEQIAKDKIIGIKERTMRVKLARSLVDRRLTIEKHLKALSLLTTVVKLSI